MAEYIEIGQLWKCDTCYHNDIYGCALGLGCDHGESYRPAYGKLKKADVAPVVHGRWEAVLEGVWNLPMPVCVGWRCSECGREEQNKEPYCNCGARMDGEG